MSSFSADLIAKLGQAELYRHFPPATGVAFDSRRVRPGDAFFALPGETMHGIQFANAALNHGAAFVVSDRLHPRGIQVADPAACLLALGRYARQQVKGIVVGITGSAGKTSTKAMIAAALDAASSPGNFNTPYALAQVLIDHWLAGHKSKETRLVLELGIDHIGEMSRLQQLVQATHAVITLIAESHLEELGSLQTVAREKFQLLRGTQLALVSAQASTYLEAEDRSKVITYGLEPDQADKCARLSKSTLTDVTLTYQGLSLKLPYPGPAMARNATAALVLAEALGLSLVDAAERLATVKLEPGRLSHIKLGQLTVLDDSYNSNPASAQVALELLRTAPPPRTAILGDMLELGQEAESLHIRLGQQSLGLERVIAVGKLAKGIKIGNPDALHFDSVDEAQGYLERLELRGTVLIKASRGMRFERLVEAVQQGRSVA